MTVARSTDDLQIVRAKRSEARLRFALSAASNGGKTYSALEVAFGIIEEFLARGLLGGSLEGKVGVVDTERKSAQLYAHLGPFDTIVLGPPYSVERYSRSMEKLEQAGCEVIILDSISHAWAGPGGLRALLSTFDAKDRFGAYDTTINPAQDEFVDAMLRSRCHIIPTMRSKTEWVLEDKVTRSGATVKAPRRIGMAPIQRPGIEYEFTTLMDLDTVSHYATVLKNRCPLFDAWVPKKLTREHGRALAAWLLEAAPEAEDVVPGTPFERARSTAEAAHRACGRATTVPDLARAFADGEKNIKAFRGPVSDEDLRPLVAELKRIKDATKEALGNDRGGPSVGIVLDPDVADALENLLQQAHVARERFLAWAQVPVVRALALDRLQVAVSQIDTWAGQETVALKLPAALITRGVKLPTNHFEDMEDDIPF